MAKINVTIWNPVRPENHQHGTRKLSPAGSHGASANGSAADDLNIRLASLDEPEHGLTDEVINSTDVMIWWGHCAHSEVRDDIVAKVHKRVLEGMGLIVLHSGHFSKIFRAVTGTSCSLKWREAGEKERLWNIAPFHPITQGIGEYFELPHEEMYGERFDIPRPDDTVFITWYEGGDVFRSGVTFTRGSGRIFYFAPGHETFPIYYDPTVQKVLLNAARWCAARVTTPLGCRQVKELEEIKNKI